MAVDTAISGLNPITGSQAVAADQLAVADISAAETKNMTFTELTVKMIDQGLVKFQVGEPLDASLNNNECYIWLDNTVSPQLLKVKVKDNSGVVFSAVL